MSRFVVIGGGHAAGQAVASLRQDGFEGEIVVIGDEPHVPYQRPPLSKQYLSGEHTHRPRVSARGGVLPGAQGHAASRRARDADRSEGAHGDDVHRRRQSSTTNC